MTTATSTGTDATTATQPARARLLAAADELFYAEGIHTVGIDRVIEHAGVAKATLYSNFGSKDGLVAAYLRGRLERRQARTRRALEGVEPPRERILTLFDVLGSFIAEPGYHGCAFMNACAESAPGSVAFAVTDESRAWTRALFAEFAADLGVAEPELLARQLVQIYDGALASARMDRDVGAAVTARASAAVLVDAACR